MGKLGKKARKFAKKNLQSIHRQKRKQNSQFKRKKKSPRDGLDTVEGQDQDNISLRNLRKPSNEKVEDDSLDIFPFQVEDKLVEESSDSDGYLSEDPSCLQAVVSDSENHLEENGEGSSLSVQNKKILSEIEEQNKKLEKLKKKDPGFLSFLENHRKNEALGDDEMDYDDEEEEEEDDDTDMQPENGNVSRVDNARSLTSSIVNNWSRLVVEQRRVSALPSLLNAYRTACHFGAGSSHAHDSASSWRLRNSETFCSMIMFMLREGDKIFNDLLDIPSSTNRKIEIVLELQNTSKWKQVKPMIKSYLRSTLFLLSQITDAEILVYALSRLRASLIYFAAFKSLLPKLIQVTVHLWAISGETLSSCSFSILHDVASLFGSDIYNECLKKMYRAYISCCKVTEPVNLNHRQSLRDKFVDFFSIDLQKSFDLAFVSTQRLVKIFELGLRLKCKDALKKMCSWEYVLCIDLWVQFVSANARENNLQGLTFSIIQVISGMAVLFPGPRYMPLKFRCIQWLNQLSSSSGIFIPVSSLVLDLLEYSTGKEGGKPGDFVNFQKSLKLPNNCLKSQKLLEECVLVAVDLLSAHFAQWSYHISFLELATFPVVRLRSFLEKSTNEGLRTGVKRLIDQVEKNIEFVQRKREGVSFSPRDQESVKSFFQTEKSSSANAPFSQYYKSIIEKATLRNTVVSDKISSSGKKNQSKRRKRQLPNSSTVASANVASKKKTT